MIKTFSVETGLLLIDVQKGVDELRHWGGPNGKRNNPEAEKNIEKLLKAWRMKGLSVFYTVHDSREKASPLKLTLPGGEIKSGLKPEKGEFVVKKDVNSGFIGTPLEILLRRKHVTRMVAAGFFTNMCVDTTVRMAGNLGFDTYLAADACACTNRMGPDGRDYDAQMVHDISVANLHGEFCTALKTREVLALLEDDIEKLNRVQGNE